MPLVKKYLNKFKDKFECLENENLILATQNIDLRLKLKKINHEKINIVFVCHRPAVWGSLKTVYEALKKDELFNVKIVTIPNKKQLPKLGLNHEVYQSEGAEDFWVGDDVISGYEYDTGEWYDLRLLKPDYICFQQPYDIERTGAYKSKVVSRYAKLFYVAYAFDFMGNGLLEETTPKDFSTNVSFFFTQNTVDDKLVKTILTKNNNFFTKNILTGFPRYDNLRNYKNIKQDIWNYKDNKDKFRVIWTPRWTTNEGNCNFFDYNYSLLEYCDLHKDTDFIFRPHPQAFLEWAATGEFSDSQAKKYKEEFDKRENTKIDYNKSYISTFYSSNCLITDVSSIIADYFLTGNPIIYCHKKDFFNEFSQKLSEGFYWVHSWNELEKILDDLRNGIDPLKEKRQKLIKELFYLPEEGSGNLIKQIIKEDALK